jgi:hypothetical protein
MRNNLFIIILIISYSKSFGQGKNMLITGKVTFKTSKNVYVKFKSTEHISKGDSLRFLNQKTPCLLVIQKSSKSLVCKVLYNCDIKKNDVVSYYYKANSKKKKIEIPTKKIVVSRSKNPKTKNKSKENSQTVRGKLSASSYSIFSKNAETRNRMLYRFSMDASHINNSNLSFETYLNYRQYIKLKDTSAYQPNNVFNVYDLSLKYDINRTFSAVIGRKINNKTSSIGAIDGLQVEKSFGKNYVGAIAGFRPDIFDYGFNTNLLEYGGYIGRTVDNNNLYTQTTLGILQQTNNGNIDRKYAYFQHSSSILKNLNLFTSMEADLYSKDSVVKNSINLTNLYVSARYRFSRKFNIMLSYDSRKRILYYETFQTDIEKLLNDNEARQGFRTRFNFKPAKYIYAGISYSKRFQSSNQNKSDNINGHISWSKVPTIGGSLSLNFNNNSSSYLKSNIISLRHSREIIPNKLSGDFYFRVVNYNYFNNNLVTKQNYYGANLSLKLTKSLRFNIFGEVSTGNGIQNNFRLNTSIVKRFNNKRRK